MSMSIPAFHVSDASKVEGSGDVFISSRTGGSVSGIYSVRLSVSFDPGTDDYPSGSLQIKTDLSDSLNSVYKATSIELINSYGKHNPTVYLTGRCSADLPAGAAPVKGLRYWLMVADNKQDSAAQGTPDVVGFAIHDRNGNRVSYGVGPLRSGAFKVAPK